MGLRNSACGMYGALRAHGAATCHLPSFESHLDTTQLPSTALTDFHCFP